VEKGHGWLFPQTVVIPDTLTIADAGREMWDLVVVGAGLSGSIAAREAARRGSRHGGEARRGGDAGAKGMVKSRAPPSSV
jgi:ribulose 1,5-bisphosphate synthetase/thiazole synthase